MVEWPQLQWHSKIWVGVESLKSRCDDQRGKNRHLWERIKGGETKKDAVQEEEEGTRPGVGA